MIWQWKLLCTCHGRHFYELVYKYKAQSQSNCSFNVLYYIDDLFLLFDHYKDIDKVFKIFNSHNNIAFTKELEENNTLPFLNILIHQTNKNINISVYRKPTHTGLYTPWNSYVPIQFKQNLIKTSLNRSHHICNNYINKHKEIQTIFKSLLHNGYPKSFINKNIKQFEIKFQSQNNSTPQSNAFDEPSLIKIVYIKLPYVQEISNQLSKEINYFFQKFDTNMKLCLIHTICKLKK